MNRIEPGCLCYSYDPKAEGQCTAVKLHAAGSKIEAERDGIDSIYRILESAWEVVTHSGDEWLIAPRYLVRIDDHQEETETQEEEMMV